MRTILGISAYYHDSAAALLRDGEIVAAAQEERFSRVKNDDSFPKHAVDFCLRHAGIGPQGVDAVVFYEKPIIKFVRSLETWVTVAPRGFSSFVQVMPTWLSERLNIRGTLRDEMPEMPEACPVWFAQHHQSHAASAFFPSPFSDAAILTIDGVGEYSTTTIGSGRGNQIEMLRELRFPHSLGLLYSAFTAYCGFRVNSGEYKLMGLAPYGEPAYAKTILDQLVDLKSDGSLRLNLEYFDFLRGKRMTNEKFHALFGGPPRKPDAPLDARHMNVARSIQAVTEEIVLRMARYARETTGHRNLCMAGGVALNCVANGLLLREKIFDRIWIQPAAGDAGGALGAALAAWYSLPAAKPRTTTSTDADAMKGSLLGPEFNDNEIERILIARGAVYRKCEQPALIAQVADLLRDEKVVGWFQGRMEFGPRALGNRSILSDARSPRMQSVLNLKIKFRESFRPFAPIVRAGRTADYFDLDTPSPYMLLVAPVKESLRRPRPGGITGIELLRHSLSSIPAVTHVDYSARIQTVDPGRNPLLDALLREFETKTGCAVLVNTSYNVRGEPVVCAPEDAYRCFRNTEMDALAIGNFLLLRSEQTANPYSRGVNVSDDLETARPTVRRHGPRLKENPAEWRKFAAVWSVAPILVCSWLRWRGRLSPALFWWAAATAAAAVVWSLIRPRHFRGPYRAVMTASHQIGGIVGKISLTIFFFIILTPFAMVMRAAGKDVLDLKLDPGAKSWWRDAKTFGGFDRAL
jgi:carbamoyltransferase